MTPLLFCARLESTAVLRLTGEDREVFLQGQLTNDITRLTSESLMTAGWCSPKGRLLTVFQLAREPQAVLLLVPRSNLEALVKRLKMYILRSRVKVTEASDLAPVGLVGDVSQATLPAGSRCFTVGSGDPRALDALGLPAGRALALIPADAPFKAQADESIYWAASAAAGVPTITLEVTDQFVPQGVNLELVNGVSFSKGCYTGQEIVSRVEHIGKTPRRAALFLSPQPLAAGTAISTVSEEVGTVVCGGLAPKGAALLVQCALPHLNDALHSNNVVLTPLPLPYSYERQHQKAS